jgi:hypothetical protein
VTARRKSVEEGSEITMTHETIHVSGLREVFNLYKLKVANGLSYNSEKYKAFAGEFQTDDYKKLDLNCEVKQRDDKFIMVKYLIERTDLVLG